MDSLVLVLVVASVGISTGFENTTNITQFILIKLPTFDECPMVRNTIENIPSADGSSSNESYYQYNYLETENLGDNGLTSMRFRGCPCKLNQPCLRKCCRMGEMVTEDGDCVKSEFRAFLPSMTDDDGTRMRTVDSAKHFVFIFWTPCSIILDPEQNPDEVFFLRASDGKLSLPNKNMSLLGPREFCLDYVLEKSAYLPFLCNSTMVERENNSLTYTLYPIGLLISAPFLLVTFLVYALIKELRNIHGKTLMCLVASYFVSFVFLAMGQLGVAALSKDLCLASAFITEFSFLAAFFWLNIMCFDITLTFSGLHLFHKSSQRMDQKKFFLYSVYAWGGALTILIVSVVLEYAPGLPESIIRPKFGLKNCWFGTDKALGAYFYGPIAALLLCNIIMFIITSVSLYRLKKETAMLKTGDSGKHAEVTDGNRQRFNLYLKLMIIMGVNWVMELIQWVVKGPDYLWYLSDIGNSLQGIFIFIIFVWKEKIRHMLLQKLCPKVSERLSGGNNLLSSLIPFCANVRITPSQSETSSRCPTMSTGLPSTTNKESLELITITKTKP